MHTIRTYLSQDLIGALASALCLVHCLTTPLLFAAHTAHLHEHHDSPAWWGFLDILLIVISGIAVYWSAKHSSKTWVKYALWLSWLLLFGIILNEKIQLIPIAEALIYIPSLALIVLHLYNRNYCKCQNESCCSH